MSLFSNPLKAVRSLGKDTTGQALKGNINPFNIIKKVANDPNAAPLTGTPYIGGKAGGGGSIRGAVNDPLQAIRGAFANPESKPAATLGTAALLYLVGGSQALAAGGAYASQPKPPDNSALEAELQMQMDASQAQAKSLQMQISQRRRAQLGVIGRGSGQALLYSGLMGTRHTLGG
jgi:hypothetical protein